MPSKVPAIPDRGLLVPTVNWCVKFESLERMRTELIKRLSDLDSDTLEYRPAADAWSALHVAQHLMLCDAEVLRQLRQARYERRTLRDRLGCLLVNFVLRKGFRVKAPMASVVPDSPMSLNEIRNRWDAIRVEMAALLQRLPDCDTLIFRHPIAGVMNITQTLELIEVHFRHHYPQLERAINRRFGSGRRIQNSGVRCL